MNTVNDPNTIVLAGDVLTWATQKTSAIDVLVKMVAGVMVVIAVLSAYWRTKSWVATLVAFVLGALVLWGIMNMPSLRDKVGSEIDEKQSAGVSISVMHVRVQGPADLGTLL
ncbi:hypothetical protein [Embleya sp. MST-111070]|uniref:hypothetical protein n=1 Tax=Embleya sp. MST-111070 TaxID=3398231 RepID=UPI003F73419D